MALHPFQAILGASNSRLLPERPALLANSVHAYAFREATTLRPRAGHEVMNTWRA